jgi:hypothetical protein
VSKDDPLYDAWPHRKPSKKSKARARIEAFGVSAPVAAVAQHVGTEVARSATRTAKSTAKKVGAAVFSAASVAGTGAVIAAGLAGWIVGDLARTAGQSRELRIESVNQNYLHAKSELRRQLGREPTAEEWEPLKVGYKKALAEAMAYTSQLRAGAE